MRETVRAVPWRGGNFGGSHVITRRASVVFVINRASQVKRKHLTPSCLPIPRSPQQRIHPIILSRNSTNYPIYFLISIICLMCTFTPQLSADTSHTLTNTRQLTRLDLVSPEHLQSIQDRGFGTKSTVPPSLRLRLAPPPTQNAPSKKKPRTFLICLPPRILPCITRDRDSEPAKMEHHLQLAPTPISLSRP